MTAGWGAQAFASGLQVTPVSLTISSGQNAGGLWLSNEGDIPISAQVRVYNWTQNNFADNLSPSQNLVISPPMLALAPGQRQFIRVIRTGLASNGFEEHYRLFIDELPPTTLQKNKLQFVLHYSLPVFIQPESKSASTIKLQWTLKNIGKNDYLDVKNQGGNYAQISAVTYISPRGVRKEITPGLLGYVLPGITMRWILPMSNEYTNRGSKLEVTINGEKTLQDL